MVVNLEFRWVFLTDKIPETIIPLATTICLQLRIKLLVEVCFL